RRLRCRPARQRSGAGRLRRRQIKLVRRSPLLCHSLDVGRQRHPGMARLLPNREHRRRKIRLGEVADGHGDNSWKGSMLKVDRGAAGRTEMASQRIAAFALSLPRGRGAVEGDLLAAESRKVAEDGAGAALALEAMASPDA